jgi:hypothetical protein
LRTDDPSAPSVLRGQILYGNLDNTFGLTTVLTRPNSLPIGLADMNRDGRLELVTWNVVQTAIEVWTLTVNGDYGFGSQSSPAGQQMLNPAIADLNEDGVPDVVGISADTHSLIFFPGRSGNIFNPPTFTPLASSIARFVIADFNDDGRLDYLADDGTFAAGKGDGTFSVVRQINRTFNDAITVDFDGDGLPDVLLNGSGYAAMVLFNRGTAGPNLAPIADAWRDITVPYDAQFQTPGVSVTAVRSYDPNLDPITYQWLDASGAVRSTSSTFDITGFAPGTYVFTLVVRDDKGAEGRDAVTVTITGGDDIVAYAAGASYHGSWTPRSDATAAAATAAWDPNASAPKQSAPLANPANYVEFTVHPDPTKSYKLWLRLKAEGNNWANDSVFVQFEGAVDASGHAAYPIGSASGLAVNLEECLNCGVSGWGWRDDAWGTKGAISGFVIRFPDAGSGGVRIRIQTREDGVMIDQVVLSSKTYVTTRPGTVKNDTVILGRTEF